MASPITRGWRTGAAITPSDANPQEPLIVAFIVSGAGNIALQSRGNTGKVTIAVNAGEIYEIESQWLYATGTTATGIVSLVKA